MGVGAPKHTNLRNATCAPPYGDRSSPKRPEGRGAQRGSGTGWPAAASVTRKQPSSRIRGMRLAKLIGGDAVHPAAGPANEETA